MMEHTGFERLKAEVFAASAEQTLQIEDLTQSIISERFAEIALARRTRRTRAARTCPHCRANDSTLHGKDQNGRQRFKCRGCRKTYNILTGTPMARARMPEKWGQYLDCMTGHMSVRTIVASGIGVHQVTAWRWRHRFLRAAALDNAAALSGVVEAGTTFFRRSFKGSRGAAAGEPMRDEVSVFTALDSGGNVFDSVLSSLSGIESALDGRLAAGSVLCSDASVVYVDAAAKASAEHYPVFVPDAMRNAARTGPVLSRTWAKGRLGLQRLNNHHERLKYLVNERCRGVATKYLVHYLGWHRKMIQRGFDGRSLLILSLA